MSDECDLELRSFYIRSYAVEMSFIENKGFIVGNAARKSLNLRSTA